MRAPGPWVEQEEWRYHAGVLLLCQQERGEEFLVTVYVSWMPCLGCLMTAEVSARFLLLG